MLSFSMESFSNDPLMQHLLDIVSDPASEGLILGGGFGIRMRQLELAEQGTSTLIEPVPPARATQDLDFFLRIELWIQKERGKEVRDMLDRLGYEAHRQNWQFGEPFDVRYPEHRVQVDQLARLPRKNEAVKVKDFRVGSKSGVDLHGYKTPEAFAIEDKPKLIHMRVQDANGKLLEKQVFVAHPYALLNMKIKAAHDWLKTVQAGTTNKPNAEKHVFDVYVLVAMLLREEIDECSEFTVQYADHPMAIENKRNAIELFMSQDGPGFREILRQLGNFPHDYHVFWEGICASMGIVT